MTYSDINRELILFNSISNCYNDWKQGSNTSCCKQIRDVAPDVYSNISSEYAGVEPLDGESGLGLEFDIRSRTLTIYMPMRTPLMWISTVMENAIDEMVQQKFVTEQVLSQFNVGPQTVFLKKKYGSFDIAYGLVPKVKHWPNFMVQLANQETYHTVYHSMAKWLMRGKGRISVSVLVTVTEDNPLKALKLQVFRPVHKDPSVHTVPIPKSLKAEAELSRLKHVMDNLREDWGVMQQGPLYEVFGDDSVKIPFFYNDFFDTRNLKEGFNSNEYLLDMGYMRQVAAQLDST